MDFKKYLSESTEEQIKKAGSLPAKMKIVFNKVKSGKMKLDEFEQTCWKIYNNKL